MLCHTLEKCLQKLEAEVDAKHKRNNEVGIMDALNYNQWTIYNIAES